MRVAIFLTWLVLLSSGTALSGSWHQIPNQFTEQFNSICFVDESHGFIATKIGAIYSINETGGRWKYDKVSFGEALEGIYFLDNGRIGFAFGAKGIIRKTHDSGRHWSHDTLDPEVRFYDMRFFDSTTGILIGVRNDKGKVNGIAYRTPDAGKSWDPVETNDRRFRSLCLSEEGLAVITSIHNILLSDNYGESWTNLKIPQKINPQATAISGKSGIMIGMRGSLALSGDAGQSWEEKQIISEKISLFDVLMIDSRRAYAAGTDGQILYTDDFGHNWIPEASGTPYDLLDIEIVGNRIFACGKAGALVYKEFENR